MKYLAAALACLLASAAQAQSLSGIHLGDDIASVADKLGSKPINVAQAGPFIFEKWQLADNNQLSLTAYRDSGQIVYMETDWMGYQSGATTDFPGMMYGDTTLRDIRNKLGSNGFTFTDKAAVKTQGGVATFNCYGTTTDAKVVIVFVTKIGNDEFPAIHAKHLTVGDAAKLASIIIGDANYIDSIWGRRKVFDSDYHPIEWK